MQFLRLCAIGVLAFLWLAPSASAFRPVAGQTSSISATAASSRVAVPGGGMNGTVRVVNSGSVTVFVRFGTSSVTATTNTDIPILAGAAESLDFTSDDGTAVYIAAITASSTATVYVTRGQGSVSGVGSGSSSSAITGSLATIETNTGTTAGAVSGSFNQVKIYDSAGNAVGWGAPTTGSINPTGTDTSVDTSSNTVWDGSDTTAREIIVFLPSTATSSIVCALAATAVTVTAGTYELFPGESLTVGLDGSTDDVRCISRSGTQTVTVTKLTGS